MLSRIYFFLKSVDFCLQDWKQTNKQNPISWQCILLLFCIQQMASIWGNGRLCVELHHSSTHLAAVASSHFSPNSNCFSQQMNGTRKSTFKLIGTRKPSLTLLVLAKTNTVTGRKHIRKHRKLKKKNY